LRDFALPFAAKVGRDVAVEGKRALSKEVISRPAEENLNEYRN
jgi:hypothetical protein